MDSYNFHFERMSTLDLHPLSLPTVSRLSPAKSSSSIVDQLAQHTNHHHHHHHHHQHGKGDSAYSSFSGGSNAPDYPSSSPPFLPEDLQPPSLLHQYADLKYVKAVYHPGHVLQSDARSMDQLYRSMEAISQQYRYNNNNNGGGGQYNGAVNGGGGDKALFSNREVTPSPTPPPPPHPPTPPARMDSFVTTRNLENSRVHHPPPGTQCSQPQPQQQSQQQHSRPPPPQPHNNYSPGSGRPTETAQSDLVLRTAGRRSSPPQLQQPPVYRPHFQPQPERDPEPLLNPAQPEQKSLPQVDTSNRSPPRAASQPETTQRRHGKPSSGGARGAWNENYSDHPAEGQRKRAHSAHDILDPELSQRRPPSPWSATNSSIQHKGQFYFVTGVCKPAEPAAPVSVTSSVSESGSSESAAAVETYTLREKGRCHSTMDNMFKPPQHRSPPGSNDSTTNERDVFFPERISIGRDENRISHRSSKQCSRSFDALEQQQNHLNRDIIGRHTANHPIFYCGPEENGPTLQIVQPATEVVSFCANPSSGHHKREEEQAKKGARRQPLGDLASERINKETTPMLYHLTGASRAAAAAKPKKDVNLAAKGKGSSVHKSAHKEPTSETATVAAETAKEDRGAVDVSASCNTLDDSFKKYYKEKLKVAQSKVLRETSFKRRDLQLSWPHRVRQRPELRPTAIHSFASSQDSEGSTDTLTPSATSSLAPSVISSLAPSITSEDVERGSSTKEEEAAAKDNEARKESEKENGKPAKVAQPQVARVGGRKRLTAEQKKMCYSEPEKLHQLGNGSGDHSACRSLGNESEMPFSLERDEPAGHQGEQGLVATRRRMFETRGRALSASNVSKNSLKHLQHKALVEYMERKTGQKAAAAEPQQPGPQLLTPSRQRHSLGEKPSSDWGPSRPLSGSAETKGPKKKNRPHSAGRILDAPSSSIRYAQFFSSQSGSVQCGGGHPRQASWRESQGPRQAKKCASAESLLDQPEAPSCFRNRSTSTPHAFEAQGIERDHSASANTTENCSLPTKAEEELAARPAAEGQQRVRVVAERGKSMEELGTQKVTRPSALSKSSEQLDRLKNHQAPAGTEREERRRGASLFGEGPRRGAAQGQQSERRKDTWGLEKEGQESQNRAQGQVQTSHNTQKKSPQHKRDSTPPQLLLLLGSEEEHAGPPSSRPTSPLVPVSSSQQSPRGQPGGSPGSQASVCGESRLSRPSSEASSSNPPSPRGHQETSERENTSTSSSSSSPSTTNLAKVPSEKRRSSSRTRASPPSSTSEQRELSVDKPTARSDDEFPPPDSEREVSLSCGVTTDPSLWILPPPPQTEREGQEEDAVFLDDSTTQLCEAPAPAPSSTSALNADSGTEEEEKENEKEEEEKAAEGQTTEERVAPEAETEEGAPGKPAERQQQQWVELAEAVVAADQSLARVLYPLTNRKTALMLMEQLLSEDTLLMEEHYKKKQEEHRGDAESTDPVNNGGAGPCPCPPAADSQTPQCPPEPQNEAHILEKKRALVSHIEERLRSLEETRGALWAEVQENAARGDAMEALVRERCLPVELERYALFIGDLERVVSLLLCLSARLARVQNALSTVDHNTDAEEKESLDNRHRLLCKQRDDAKDLKDNLDRRESVVSGFLSRQLSAEQLRDYRRFVQTKASLLIRQKDLEERQRLGEEQLEALRSTLPL